MNMEGEHSLTSQDGRCMKRGTTWIELTILAISQCETIKESDDEEYECLVRKGPL